MSLAFNIEVGENFFANYNCTVLDVAKVKVGKNVMLGSNVSFYTAGHPLHHESRKSGYEYGISITVGDNVWIGGSVVTRDIPDGVGAAGNPCRVIREITEEDIGMEMGGKDGSNKRYDNMCSDQTAVCDGIPFGYCQCCW